jgi:hypothetical protein
MAGEKHGGIMPSLKEAIAAKKTAQEPTLRRFYSVSRTFRK